MIVGSIKYPSESSKLPPYIISAFHGYCIIDVFTMLSKAFLSITAFIKFEVSFGEPTLIFLLHLLIFAQLLAK